MPLKYDFYKNPPSQKEPEVEYLHPRVVPFETLQTESLARLVHDRCTATTADVKLVLDALSQVMIQELKMGNRIHIDGFGYFMLTLACDPIKTDKEIRAESIRFKSIAFRPEAKLKRAFAALRVEKAMHKNHSKAVSEGAINEKLTAYFQTNASITRSAFQQLCGLTQSTAINRLNKLIAAGKLRKAGMHRFPVYEPCENN